MLKQTTKHKKMDIYDKYLKEDTSIELKIDHPVIKPITDIIEDLIECAHILLIIKDYDGHGWEKLTMSMEAAKRLSYSIVKKEDGSLL